jgi:hypothetical protein
VTEVNHPIYKVRRVNSEKEGKWVHHNRLLRKKLFDDQNKILSYPTRESLETGYNALDDCWDDDYEYPTVINNSVLDPSTTTEEPTNTAHVPQPDQDHVIVLEPNEEIEELPLDVPQQEPSLPGRSFDDNGRLLSTRTKKSTQREDYQY